MWRKGKGGWTISFRMASFQEKEPDKDIKSFMNYKLGIVISLYSTT
jgi:hypothetical protein